MTGLVARVRSLAQRTEHARLRYMPRRVSTTTRLLGTPFRIVDGPSFLLQYASIVEGRQYEFIARRPDPFILDCGANTGVACVYWKTRYPRSRIVAFEPDPEIFAALSANVARFGLADVRLEERAVWTRDGTMTFWSEGADSGRLAETTDERARALRPVRVVRLRDYLDEPVDLLKLDVEGAEVDVLLDCEDRLGNVSNLYVEYHSFADRKQRLDELLRVVIAAGFRVQVHTEAAARRPFLEGRDYLGMDLQLQIYGVRSLDPA